MHFDETGQPILTTDFPFEEIDQKAAPVLDDSDRQALSLLRLALGAAMDWKGREDGFRARMGAFALLVEDVPGMRTPTEVCNRLGISRTALWSARAKLKAELPFLPERPEFADFLSKTAKSEGKPGAKLNMPPIGK
jgi:hypothetical protein